VSTPGTRDPLRLGVLGAGSYVASRAVYPAAAATPEVEVVAVASRSGAVPEIVADVDVGSYEAVLADPRVEAVYLPLPNGLHRPWTEAAAAAGLHVLVEKPIAGTVADAEAMRRACEDAGVLLAEAWMTPFHPALDTLLAAVRAGRVGQVRHVRSRFTFTIGPGQDANYRWDPRQGGGALRDVGVYTLAPVLALLGDHAEVVDVVRHDTDRGVDATTSLRLVGADGAVADVLVSFELPEAQVLEVVGTAGTLTVTQPHTPTPDGTRVRLATTAGAVEDLPFAGPLHGVDPYRAMLEAFAAAVRGRASWPRPVPAAIDLLRCIEQAVPLPGRAG
jgi:D-xylose 1-dehydrogenase (NADP+, D-xylono-1,5-lactone-forming)